MPRLRWISITLLVLSFFLAIGASIIWFFSYHPGDVEDMKVSCVGDPPAVRQEQKLKILSWNVQYMAGKNYVFFYDKLDESGPDERPSSKDISLTLDEVARVIDEESPDIVLLQEVDEGAKRTDYADQTAELTRRLKTKYPCQSSAFYWKARFVPHPRIMGKVGMKLVTLSRFKIDKAVRYQLPKMPDNWLVKQFQLKRAVLDSILPIAGTDRAVHLLNTHLDAFAQGTDTMEQQVLLVKKLLLDLTNKRIPWVIGGDFNLLPPHPEAYNRLQEQEKKHFKPDSEIRPLYNMFQAVPTLSDVTGQDYQKWFTHFPNDPVVGQPDRTIDYLFLSPAIKIAKRRVRQQDTLMISDHLPVVAEIVLKN